MNASIPPFPLQINDFILLIVTIVLYLILKRYVALKNEIEVFMEETKRISNETIIQLNDRLRILNKKIEYVDFSIKNENLTTDEYIKNLHIMGFSIEDLKEIGVDEIFIRQNELNILPRKVVEKIIVLKESLKEHRGEQKNNNNGKG